MSWGAVGAVIGGVALPALAWWALWRGSARAARDAAVFWERPAKVDARRQAVVPLVLGAGVLAIGVALGTLSTGSDQGTASGLAAVAGNGAVALGAVALPILAIATVTSGSPKWLPRVAGSEPEPAPLASRAGRLGLVCLWFLTPFLAFVAMGIGTEAHSAWAGLIVLLAWPVVDSLARAVDQRLEVREEGIVLSSYGFDYRWDAADVECVFIDPQRMLWLRDRAGWTAQGIGCGLPRRGIERVAAQLTALGYRVAKTPLTARWRPAVPAVVRRRVAPFVGLRVFVGFFFLLEGALISALGASS